MLYQYIHVKHSKLGLTSQWNNKIAVSECFLLKILTLIK